MDLRRKREAAGLSQSELADRTGVAQPNIAAYESGRRRITPAMEARFEAALGLRPSHVLEHRRSDVLDAARRHHATNVRVFGSVARGEDTPASDLDLLVTFDQDASVFDLADLIEELRLITGIEVDVVSEAGLRPRHARIVAEAVPL